MLDHLVLAYLDPGSGSLIIQALIAGLVAVPLLMRRRIELIVDRVRGRRDASGDQAVGTDERHGDGPAA